MNFPNVKINESPHSETNTLIMKLSLLMSSFMKGRPPSFSKESFVYQNLEGFAIEEL